MMSNNNIISSTYNFAELPKELLQIIGKHLETRIDVFRFRAVSTSWRSVVSLSYHQSLSPPPSFNLPPPVSATVILSPATICRLEDQSRTSACLVKVVESASGNDLQLLNPLSPFYTSTNNNTLNMLDFRLIEICRCYNLDIKTRPSRNFTLRKVVLFDKSGILALFDSGKLGYWKFGEKKCFFLGNEGSCYDDFMVYNDQFYVIDGLGIMSWIDKSMNLVQYSPPLCGLGDLKTLIQSEGQFYVVDSYMDEEEGVAGQAAVVGFRRNRSRVDMKVYKLDEEWGSWVQVKSLGDEVFVLGKQVCFSVNIRDFPGCQGNCIYFVDSKLGDRKLRRPVGRVFRLQDGSIKTVESFPGHRRLFSPSMNWRFSAPACP